MKKTAAAELHAGILARASPPALSAAWPARYIRSAYSLPSLATLGNAICGFAAVSIAGLDPATAAQNELTKYFSIHRFRPRLT